MKWRRESNPSQTAGRLLSSISADEITSNGIPFQTALFPPPRNVGTPDSADTPAPVSTRTRRASAKRRRNSGGICMAEGWYQIGLIAPIDEYLLHRITGLNKIYM